MSKFQQKLAKFFYGRYGTDDLYGFLFVLDMVLLFLGVVFQILGHIQPVFFVLSAIVSICGVALLIWAIFRTCSKHIPARRKENAAFLAARAKCKGFFCRKRKPTLPPDTDTHTFRACPHCAAVLRLPLQAGKHSVKCPRCGASFGVRVKVKKKRS